MEGILSVQNLKIHDLIINGGPVRVYENSSSGDNRVFMLHGAMYDESRFIWDQLFPYLSQHFHVYAMDLPRHGGSRPWKIHLSNPVIVEIIRESFIKLGIKSSDIIGLSMGGGLAIAFNSLYPEFVKSLILFEPGGLGEKLDYHFLTYLYTRIKFLRTYLSSKYSNYDDRKLMKVLESLFTEGSVPRDKKRLLMILKEEIAGKAKYKEPDLDDWQLDAIGPFNLTWNVLDLIEKIDCPSLWIRGKNSSLVKEEEMKKALSLIPDHTYSKFIQIDGAGHILPLEQPAAVNKLVYEFLKAGNSGNL